MGAVVVVQVHGGRGRVRQRGGRGFARSFRRRAEVKASERRPRELVLRARRGRGQGLRRGGRRPGSRRLVLGRCRRRRRRRRLILLTPPETRQAIHGVVSAGWCEKAMRGLSRGAAGSAGGRNSQRRRYQRGIYIRDWGGDRPDTWQQVNARREVTWATPNRSIIVREGTRPSVVAADSRRGQVRAPR